MDQPATASLVDRVARVELLLLDVDGTLTDGGIIYTDTGAETKRFHVRDGAGLKAWQLVGHRVAIVSGRRSPALERRAAELGITTLLQGRADKRLALDEVLVATGLQPEQVCAVGDDLPDLPILRRVGVAIAVCDACLEVRAMADYVTALPGGTGAVRDAIEWLLKSQGKWDGVIERLTKG